jgi:CTP:molybdopterin cytidylyltransferase MocA
VTVAAVVLAAGGGTRFAGGSHKLLAPYRGRPLVVSALEAAAASGCDEIAVVTGAVDLASLVSGETTVLANPDWESGLASSLRVALAWCAARGHSAVVVGLGDMPGVPAAAWRAVAAVDAPVAVASFDGALRPPVRLAAEVWGEVPTAGDVGARDLWKRPGTVVVACEGTPDDIDTVEDLTRLSTP